MRGIVPEQKLAAFLHISPQSHRHAAKRTVPADHRILAALYAAPKGAEIVLSASSGLTRAQINAIVCAVRVLCLLVAVGFGGRLRVVRRLLMYKGALNKCINCYECTRMK